MFASDPFLALGTRAGRGQYAMSYELQVSGFVGGEVYNHMLSLPGSC